MASFGSIRSTMRRAAPLMPPSPFTGARRADEHEPGAGRQDRHTRLSPR
jgi:hypothetical protein